VGGEKIPSTKVLRVMLRHLEHLKAPIVTYGCAGETLTTWPRRLMSWPEMLDLRAAKAVWGSRLVTRGRIE
jgi:hypothetical protein